MVERGAASIILRYLAFWHRNLNSDSPSRMTDVHFADHLNLVHALGKPFILPELHKTKEWNKRHFVANETEIFLCVLENEVSVASP
jgi:hypothetical protein